MIWDKWQEVLEQIRKNLNNTLRHHWPTISKGKSSFKSLEDWEVPSQRHDNWPLTTDTLVSEYWEARIARQKEIDGSIAAKAEYEYLYDKPYDDKRKVRVAGPFTVESLSPHRVLGVNENDELIDKGTQRRIQRQAVFPPDDSGEPQNGRRSAGPQGGQDHLRFADPVAR